MNKRIVYFGAVALYVFALSSGLPVGVAAAQEAGAATGCLQAPMKLDTAALEPYLKDPSLMMARDAGVDRAAEMERRIRRVVGSQVDAVKLLEPFIRTATPDEKASIAKALGYVANVCAPNQPLLALTIQGFIAGFQDPELVEAFLASTGDKALAALFGGGGAPGGAPGLGSSAAGTGTDWGEGSTPSRSGTGAQSAGFGGGGGFATTSTRSSSPSRVLP